MLRWTLLSLARQSWLRHWMENSPVSRRLTSRFIAGHGLEDGIRAIRQLSKEKIFATLDFLGENVTSLEEAAHSLDSYLAALDEIEQCCLTTTVSIKLTQFGLDFSEEACRNNVATLIHRAKNIGSRVEIDMEGSEYTERTLKMACDLQEQFGEAIRVAIQAYLYRSEADIEMLSARGIPVRLCKGAYREPPEIAFPKKDDVDRNYVQLMKVLLTRGAYPAIASHDEQIIQEACRYIKEQKIAPDRFEFQMLYGIRRDLQRKLTAEGYRLRSYVPYGEAWYPYFMRRLAERPANVWFVARNLMSG